MAPSDFKALAVTAELHGKIKQIAALEDKKVYEVANELMLPIATARLDQLKHPTKKEPNGSNSERQRRK